MSPAFVTINKIEYSELNTGGGYSPVVLNPNPSSIQSDQDWQIEFDWTQSGALFGGFTGVNWELEILLEKLGRQEYTGPAISTTEAYVNGNPHNYNKVISVPAATMTGEEGVYRIVARLALRDAVGLYPVSAFQDLGYVQFYLA